MVAIIPTDATTFALTTTERAALAAKLDDLKAQELSIYYRDALDTRTSAQIEHEVDQLYSQIDAVVSVLTVDANLLLPDGLPDHVREVVALAPDPLEFLAAIDDADYQRWCERDHA